MPHYEVEKVEQMAAHCRHRLAEAYSLRPRTPMAGGDLIDRHHEIAERVSLNQRDLPKISTSDHLSHVENQWEKAVIVCDGVSQPLLDGQAQHITCLLDVDAERFVYHHMLAALEGIHDLWIVVTVRGADFDDLNLAIVDELTPVGVDSAHI